MIGVLSRDWRTRLRTGQPWKAAARLMRAEAARLRIENAALRLDLAEARALLCRTLPTLQDTVMRGSDVPDQERTDLRLRDDVRRAVWALGLRD